VTLNVNEVRAAARRRIAVDAAAVNAAAEAVDEVFVRAASMILSCPGKLFIGGSGTSGAVAHRMAHILSVTGTPSVYFSPMDSLHGGAGAVSPQDLVLLISKGGASDEVLECARVMRERGVTTLGLSRSATTGLARSVDLALVLDVPDRTELGGVVATGITMAQAAWGDALAEVLMRARRYTLREFHDTHPAGAVGQLDELPDDLPPLDLPVHTWNATEANHG
jgi:D-arabinose 5-phosphate isomerase GutQ